MLYFNVPTLQKRSLFFFKLWQKDIFNDVFAKLIYLYFQSCFGWCPFNTPVHIPPGLNETLENEEIYISFKARKLHR